MKCDYPKLSLGQIGVYIQHSVFKSVIIDWPIHYLMWGLTPLFSLCYRISIDALKTMVSYMFSSPSDDIDILATDSSPDSDDNQSDDIDILATDSSPDSDDNQSDDNAMSIEEKHSKPDFITEDLDHMSPVLASMIASGLMYGIKGCCATILQPSIHNISEIQVVDIDQAYLMEISNPSHNFFFPQIDNLTIESALYDSLFAYTPIDLDNVLESISIFDF